MIRKGKLEVLGPALYILLASADSLKLCMVAASQASEQAGLKRSHSTADLAVFG